MTSTQGMTYAPKGKPAPACKPGELVFAAVGLDHGHVLGMCNGLTEAGAELRWVFDEDAGKAAELAARFPGARVAASEAQVLEDPGTHLVASAKVPADHASLGTKVMAHGKDYFTDKPAVTTLGQLAAVRQAVAATGRKYAVYFSERVHVESSVMAGQLLEEGAIGKPLHVLGLGPHRASLEARPAWFFERERYGGILCDLGSHQVEQFLYFSRSESARVVQSRVANLGHRDRPGLEDFGDCTLAGDNGATGYFRVDWFTPDGLGVWGDGRLVVLGTEGYMELRKYVDIARSPDGDHVYLVDAKGEHHFEAKGKTGYPFFGQLVRDCLDRTETSMTQEHVLTSAELCVLAESSAERVA